MTWSSSDAWLLTAAYVTEENPVSLRSLFAAGDAINHAIFTDEEIDHGLTRLEAAGLACLDGETHRAHGRREAPLRGGGEVELHTSSTEWSGSKRRCGRSI